MLAPQLQEASTNSLGGIVGVMYLLSITNGTIVLHKCKHNWGIVVER